MEEQILKEVAQIKQYLARIVGTSNLPKREQFSKKALDKTAVEFRKLETERKEWIPQDEIHRVIRNAPWHAGKFIIEKFGFNNYFKYGRTLYFNRKDLVDLKNELKVRNVNLNRYMELLEDQEKFKKKIDALKASGGRRGRGFKVPEGLKDIVITPYSPPDEKIVEDHIESLLEQFEKENLNKYIDIYESNYAMVKFECHFERYFDKDLRKKCRRWCDDFNYAQNALKEIKRAKISSKYL